MKIGIYCNNYKPEDGGANTLLGTVLKEIKEREDLPDEYLFFYCGSRKEPYEKVIDGYHYYNLNHNHLVPLEFASKVTRILGIELTKRFDRIVKREGIDMVWFLSHFYAYTELPNLFTVWDLGHITTSFPEVNKWYIKRGREYMYRNMIRRATYVITGNNTGKKEIQKGYNCPEEKIHIAEFPVSSFCFGKSQKPDFVTDELFFFYPAQFWPHKNHVCVVKALEILKKQYHLTPKVYFTGSDKGHRAYITELIQQAGLENQIEITGFVPDEALKYLYENAYAMIFASMMGPNNLPPIEALFLGCPVIISGIEGHREQLGDNAAFFDGDDPASLAKVLKDFLESSELRNRYAEKADQMRPVLEAYRYMDSFVPLIEKLRTQIG